MALVGTGLPKINAVVSDTEQRHLTHCGSLPHMPRFYFDIREGADLVRDEEGMEFPDLASAEREAEEAAASLVRNLRYAGKQIKITIEVRDERGTRLTGASATLHVERGVAAAS
jgi:hypothetical protein